MFYSLYDMDNIKRAKNDLDYLGELITENKNLIWFSIHKYVNISTNMLDTCGATKDDLYQLGCIGFMKAIKAFNIKRGVKFSSFAAITIAREVKHFLRSNYSILRISRGSQSLLASIKDIEEELGYIPNQKELADLLNVSVKRIQQVTRVGGFVYSLEEINYYDMSYFESIESDEQVDLSVENKLYIDKLLEIVEDKLKETEIEVLKLQLSGNSQSDTARDLGLSNMKVSRIVRKIREVLNEEEFIKNESVEKLF